MRVGRHRGDPETALVIKRELHGVGEIGELLLTGEHLNLVAFRHGQ